MDTLKKVLLIDGSPHILSMYKMLLMRYQCAVLDARNGQEGLHKLTENPDVNLVFLDIDTPLMNGLEFIRTVKEQEQCRHIPIVISSPRGREQDADAGLALGAKDCLRKPFASSEMHALIQRLYPVAAKVA